ncbi:hypothetical protein QBC44DRAFT_376376 [Cladorrhinum sp. PSN332]|nr:hypothetical protein QBC44DRAFT_376376 [Cladorrhinum sp. PSN332]
MDPASSIELASGILSFILFAGKLIKGGVEIYRNGDLSDNATLQDVITKMESFHSRHKLPGHDEDLNDILTDCSNVSTHLLRLLKKMQPPGSRGGFRAAWRSLSASWNNVFHENERRELEEKLGRCHGRLGLLLAWSTSITVDKLVSSIAHGEESMEQIQGRLDELNSFLREGSGMGWLVDSVRNEVQRSINDQERKLWDTRIHQCILKSLQYDKMRDRSHMLKQHVSVINEQQKANGGTFQWLFESGARNVNDKDEEVEMKNEARMKWSNWISAQSDAGVFHIAGKFGSGKSTLMQFLFDHPHTQAELERWAGDRKLVKVNFFFSVVIGGTQQLLRGLCRTLLYDILDQCPSLTQNTLPRIWAKVCRFRSRSIAGHTVEVDDSEILTALGRIFGGYDPNFCFCIFIDGLDEYQDTNGRDQSDLVDLIKGWATGAQNTVVKICVASREDPAFYNKFPPKTTVRLHELTRYDMERFSEQRLHDIRDENIRNQLIKEIPEKAQGVFLWAQLVVQEIREDLEVGDPSIDALDRFPAGLRPLLARMMKSIPERHRQKAYLSFSMLLELSKLTSREDQRGNDVELFLSGVAYSFLQDYCKDGHFAYKMSTSAWWKIDFVEHDLGARRILDNVGKVGLQLKAWCKGLLDTAPLNSVYGEYEVTQIVFTHRSIQEYLEEPVVQVELSAGLLGLSPPDAISQLLLAEFIHNGRAYDGSRWESALLLLRAQHGMDESPYTFLDRWHHIATQRKLTPTRFPTNDKKSETLRGCITVNCSVLGSAAFETPSDETMLKAYNFATRSPLHVSILLGECDYAIWKLKNDPRVFDDGFQVASMAYTVFWLADNPRIMAQSVFDFLDLMLVKGRKEVLQLKTWFYRYIPEADDTVKFDMSNPLTIWQHYLIDGLSDLQYVFRKRAERIQPEAFRSKSWVAFGKVVEAFLRAGADPCVLFGSLNAGAEENMIGNDPKPLAVLQLGNDVAIHYHMRLSDPSDEDLSFSADSTSGYQMLLDYRDPITFRDWIELLDIPNRDTLLDLIDRSLATRNKNSEVDNPQTQGQLPDLKHTESNSNSDGEEQPEAETKQDIPRDEPPEAEPEQIVPSTTVPALQKTSFQLGYVISFVLGVSFAYVFLVVWT